jgi:hypothetical protein
MKPADIKTLLQLAREHGVTELTTTGLSFKLGPAPSTGAPGKSSPLTPPTCPCGHAVYDHTRNGCLHCGPSEKCLQKEKRHA